MSGSNSRASSVLAAKHCAWFVIASGAVALCHSAAAEPRPFDVPSGEASTTLPDFARKAGLELLFDYTAVKTVKTHAVSGRLEPEAALAEMLRGTAAQFEKVDGRTIAIRPADAAAASSDAAAPQGVVLSDNTTAVSTDQPPNTPAPRAASVDQTPPPSKADVPGARLEEIVVTARKRSERLQDVPVPVTSISADTLVATNQLRLQDYYALIPGLNVVTDDYGVPQVTIRGLTTGTYTNPTVGIVVDDVPYGSSSTLAFGQEVPDFDPGDLARVEVLRGPQGTLYGASSLGGLIKYVTVDPSIDRVDGRVQAGVSSVYNGTELGYNVRGSINVPLSDTLAIRASGFTRRDPGYIDNVETGQRGINKGEVDGGRLSALWRPSQEFSLRLSALVQHTSIDGSSYVEVQPGLEDLQQNNVRGTGWYKQTLQAYSATLTAKVGGIDLTAVSGYNVNAFSDSVDLTPILGTSTTMEFGVTGTPVVNHIKTTKLTEEIRLSAPIGQKFEWMFGAFYTHERSPQTQEILATVPATGALVGEWLHDITPFIFTEYAAFADVTFHVTDRFDVQIGGRESHNRQALTETFVGVYDLVLLGLPSPVVYPEVDTKDNSLTYLVTPRFKVSSDLMVYARVASGYRPGGPNSTPALRSFKPDTTQNYEIGIKRNILGHTLSFDASLYYIDWKDIQLTLIDRSNGFGYYANASRAKSQGVELSVESQPLPGLTITAWGAWNDAVLTAAFPTTSTVYGSAGDRLPYSSRFSGSVSLEQEYSLTSSVTGFVGASESYIGYHEGIFTGSAQRQHLPAYAKTDVRAGVRYESWTAYCFVTNVSDKRGLLNGGLGTFNPLAFQYIQPRTVGLLLARTF